MSREQTSGPQAARWPFPVPANTAALTTAPVLAGHPILLVSHDAEDGCWQFLCGTTTDPAAGRVVGIGQLIDGDPSLRQLADLPRGWRAWRRGPGMPWQRRAEN